VTDGQTDGRTDGRAIAYTRYSMLSRAKIEKKLFDEQRFGAAVDIRFVQRSHDTR